MKERNGGKEGKEIINTFSILKKRKLSVFYNNFFCVHKFQGPLIYGHLN